MSPERDLRAEMEALATTHGVIGVTVAVRGTPIARATAPNQSPGRIIARGPRIVWLTPAGTRRSGMASCHLSDPAVR